MRRNRWLLIPVLASGLVAGSGRLGFADDLQASQPEFITVRGESMRVWPFDDLRARGFDVPEVPRDENAYWVYLDAINAYKEMPDDVREAFSYVFSKAWPAEHGERLKKFLLDKDNQKALSLARQAAAKEKFQCYYFGDPRRSIITVLLPSLSDYRQIAKMLVADGRRLEEQGDYNLAFQDYTAALRMGHHVASGITLIENLVGVSIWALGDRAISQMVLRRDMPAKQLEDILDLLNDLGPSCPTSLGGVKNERLFGLTIVDELTAHPFDLIHNLRGTWDWNVGSPTTRQNGWRRLEARIGQIVLPDRTVKKHMAGYYDQIIERAGKPAYEARWSEFDEEEAISSIPQWDIMASIFLPLLSRASVLADRCHMQTVATRLTVALRLFAKENKGQPPLRLEELRDWLPADDLIDPFSGETFVYDRRGRAWRFYSFSNDLEDNAGTEGRKRFEPDYVVRFPPADIEPFVSDEEDEGTEPL